MVHRYLGEPGAHPRCRPTAPCSLASGAVAFQMADGPVVPGLSRPDAARLLLSSFTIGRGPFTCSSARRTLVEVPDAPGRLARRSACGDRPPRPLATCCATMRRIRSVARLLPWVLWRTGDRGSAGNTVGPPRGPLRRSNRDSTRNGCARAATAMAVGIVKTSVRRHALDPSARALLGTMRRPAIRRRGGHERGLCGGGAAPGGRRCGDAGRDPVTPAPVSRAALVQPLLAGGHGAGRRGAAWTGRWAPWCRPARSIRCSDRRGATPSGANLRHLNRSVRRDPIRWPAIR